VPAMTSDRDADQVLVERVQKGD
jgi:hypothetical protein